MLSLRVSSAVFDSFRVRIGGLGRGGGVAFKFQRYGLRRWPLFRLLACFSFKGGSRLGEVGFRL